MTTQLGRYELREQVGRGNAGTVWDAWDTVLTRRVAIKVVRVRDKDEAELEELLTRFRLEAQLGSRFSHPGVVQVYDYGEIDGEAFIVMEFVEGETLKTRLDRAKPLPLQNVTEIMRGVLGALERCHRQDIVHRDIKPANIMLPAAGGVKLADFGIARAENSELTIIGTVMGTPLYMSPEQFTARHPVDFHSDIWSAGVVLYEMLTGARPFTGGNMATIGQAVVNDEFEAPSRRLPSLPPALDRVVARALRKSPEERYPSAQAFWMAIEEAVPAPSAKPAPAPAGGTVSRAMLLAGISGLVLAAAGGGWWYLGGHGEPARRPVESMPAERPPRPAAPVANPTPVPASPPMQPAPVQQTPVQPPPVQPPVQQTPAQPRPAPIEPPAAAGEPRLSVATRVVALPCSTVTARTDRNVSTFRGIIGSGAPKDALDAIVSQLPAAEMTVQTFPATNPSCQLAELVRAHAGAARLTARGGGATLLTGDEIRVRLKMPEFAGSVRLDVLDATGTISHMMEANLGVAPRYPADVSVGMGVGGDDLIGHAGEPYGTDLLMAIVSSEPLVTSPRPGEEEGGAFLGELSAAIATLLRRGGRVEADAILVTTARR